MAVIFLRARMSEQGRRALGAPGAGLARKKAMQDLCDELGFEHIEICRSTSGEAVNILRGPAEKVVLMQQIMDRTGAYASLEAEILETIDELSVHEELARKIAPKFIPPDRDEIDRMLLDE